MMTFCKTHIMCGSPLPITNMDWAFLFLHRFNLQRHILKDEPLFDYLVKVNYNYKDASFFSDLELFALIPF